MEMSNGLFASLKSSAIFFRFEFLNCFKVLICAFLQLKIKERKNLIEYFDLQTIRKKKIYQGWFINFWPGVFGL